MINEETLEYCFDFLETARRTGSLELIVGGAMFVFAVQLLMVGALFFLGAYGFYRLNIRLGNKRGALAFVPGLSGYAFGMVADSLKMKRQSNFRIHLLMLGFFCFLAFFLRNAILISEYFGIYEELKAGTSLSVKALYEEMIASLSSNRVYLIANVADSYAGIVLSVFEFLAFLRILVILNAKHGFLWTTLSILFAPVRYIYVFAVRNRPLYPDVIQRGGYPDGPNLFSQDPPSSDGGAKKNGDPPSEEPKDGDSDEDKN